MKFAVCSLNHRISPLLQHTKEIILVNIGKNKKISIKEIKVSFHTPKGLISILKDLKVNIVICGGIKEEYFLLLRNSKIKVIENIIGEVDDVIKQINSDFLK